MTLKKFHLKIMKNQIIFDNENAKNSQKNIFENMIFFDFFKVFFNVDCIFENDLQNAIFFLGIRKSTQRLSPRGKKVPGKNVLKNIVFVICHIVSKITFWLSMYQNDKKTSSKITVWVKCF